MIDPLPKLLIELRDNGAVDDIVDGRVRGWEPAPGDEQPKGSYKAFVVVVRLTAPREPGIPVQRPRIAVRCYGRTKEEAYDLYGACSDAIHHVGPRIHNNGLGIYLSHDDTGASQDVDPDTKQPLETFIVDLFATTQAVTP